MYSFDMVLERNRESLNSGLLSDYDPVDDEDNDSKHLGPEERQYIIQLQRYNGWPILLILLVVSCTVGSFMICGYLFGQDLTDILIFGVLSSLVEIIIGVVWIVKHKRANKLQKLQDLLLDQYRQKALTSFAYQPFDKWVVFELNNILKTLFRIHLFAVLVAVLGFGTYCTIHYTSIQEKYMQKESSLEFLILIPTASYCTTAIICGFCYLLYCVFKRTSSLWYSALVICNDCIMYQGEIFDFIPEYLSDVTHSRTYIAKDLHFENVALCHKTVEIVVIKCYKLDAWLFPTRTLRILIPQRIREEVLVHLKKFADTQELYWKEPSLDIISTCGYLWKC